MPGRVGIALLFQDLIKEKRADLSITPYPMIFGIVLKG